MWKDFKGIWKTLEGSQKKSEGFSRVMDLQAVTIPKKLEKGSKDFGSILEGSGKECGLWMMDIEGF